MSLFFTKHFVSHITKSDHFMRWINGATKKQLMNTQSVGKVLTHRIITNRRYSSEHDVDALKMIGDKRMMYLIRESMKKASR